MKQELEYRMYGLVPYNISPIQQAIQFGHAVVEYMINDNHGYSREHNNACEKWAESDKTFIILNGGTTNNKGDHRLGHGGTLNKHLFTLSDNNIPISSFYEPDLGDQLTAIVFLADERVWDKEKYPDWNPAPTPDGVDIGGGITVTPEIHLVPETTEEYVNRLGGQRNVFLREFLRKFRLA